MKKLFRATLAASLLLTLAALLSLVPLAGATAQPVRGLAKELSEADRNDIARIERHLNSFATMESRFLQVTSAGDYAEGQLYFSRPGRLRIEYDPPVPVLIVANGTWLTYIDKQLEQVSRVLLSNTPAGILVAERVSLLSTELTVTGIERGRGSIRVTVVKNEDPAEGSLTLVFSDRPLSLKKWIVVDAQGVATTVSLLGPRTGVRLKSDLFDFKDPRQRKSDP